MHAVRNAHPLLKDCRLQWHMPSPNPLLTGSIRCAGTLLYVQPFPIPVLRTCHLQWHTPSPKPILTSRTHCAHMLRHACCLQLDVVPKEDLRPEGPEGGSAGPLGGNMLPQQGVPPMGGMPGMAPGGPGMMPPAMFPFPFNLPPGSEALMQVGRHTNRQGAGRQAFSKSCDACPALATLLLEYLGARGEGGVERECKCMPPPVSKHALAHVQGESNSGMKRNGAHSGWGCGSCLACASTHE